MRSGSLVAGLLIRKLSPATNGDDLLCRGVPVAVSGQRRPRGPRTGCGSTMVVVGLSPGTGRTQESTVGTGASARPDGTRGEGRRGGESLMSGPVVQSDPEVASAAALAEKLLRAGGHRGRWVQVAAVAMARALVKTTPGSEHGKVLAAALRAPRLDAPAGVGAVLRLARAGVTPTEAAVASCLEQQDRRNRRQVAARALARGLVGADVEGPRAAAWVAQVLAQSDDGPTWGELAAAMGWPRPVAGVQIRALITSRWLTGSSRPRSLRPGPLFPAPAGQDAEGGR
jgi:hypothetical protein